MASFLSFRVFLSSVNVARRLMDLVLLVRSEYEATTGVNFAVRDYANWWRFREREREGERTNERMEQETGNHAGSARLP